MAAVKVIGGGLAGCEAAYALAKRGIDVELYEMKPEKFSPAHKSAGLAELVCSNSLKAERTASAAGLLKQEMRRLGSLCLECADECRVPAGGALAVDRDEFSALITAKIEANPKIKIIRSEVTEIPSDGVCIVAAGPLASDALSKSISLLCGCALSFFDAAAPIVTAESIDMDEAFTQSRYDRGGEDDYINCPLDKAQYEAFYSELVNAQSAELHEFDRKKDVYEGCMPIEALASRGLDAIRYGPLKPVGLCNPKTGHRPWAALQLRKENKQGTLYNLVGFQTNLKFGEQKRVFSMFPALRNAEFVRYGVMHRNTFINSPKLLKPSFAMRENPDLFFAGQITGVEGYMESAGSGILAGINAARHIFGEPELVLPVTTMLGALSAHVSTTRENDDFQPMGAAFGLLPPLEEKIRDKRERYEALSQRSLAILEKEIKKL
ncbi:MAG: methylenetetrahydrofolate--tRNA-(uracil(54)-C(5))-methyltransferase (FADH(2)-oxidizing) TrmFO [Clostridiales bacterium]|nr:methylenetetrahydrofolate--tRNA-(uracil(54)-C(5))-methyltransferase (FADH(2)-oxidizing) TrmFO [Clostridiales bacterium]